MSEMDKLEYMFMCQQDLQEKLLDVKLPDDKPEFMSIYALGLISEVGEVLQADKRWKIGLNWTGGDTRHYERGEVINELTDCMLYLINLILACDIGCDEFFESFIKVQNKVRDRNGLEKVRYPK